MIPAEWAGHPLGVLAARSDGGTYRHDIERQWGFWFGSRRWPAWYVGHLGGVWTFALLPRIPGEVPLGVVVLPSGSDLRIAGRAVVAALDADPALPRDALFLQGPATWAHSVAFLNREAADPGVYALRFLRRQLRYTRPARVNRGPLGVDGWVENFLRLLRRPESLGQRPERACHRFRSVAGVAEKSPEA